MSDRMPGLGRLSNPETPLARQAYPITPLFRRTEATYRNWWQGGAWLDQGQFGTCVGNAFAHRRADGPVRVEGITEDYARKLYLDASGDTTYQQGTSGLAACRVLMQRGSITAYHWVTTASELRNAVLTLGSICVGTDWFNSMFTPVRRYRRAWLNVDPSSGLAGGHEYVINGINVAPSVGPPRYRGKQSWGRQWGDSGNFRIACSDLEELIFSRGGDAVLITEQP